MHACTCIYLYTPTLVYTHPYIAYMHTCIHSLTHTYTCMHTYIVVHTHIHEHTHSYTSTCAYLHTPSLIHTYTHTLTRAHAGTRRHTRAHAHTAFALEGTLSVHPPPLQLQSCHLPSQLSLGSSRDTAHSLAHLLTQSPEYWALG